MYFSVFLFDLIFFKMIFKINFLSKIAKKRKRTCGADVASGPRRGPRRADVATG